MNILEIIEKKRDKKELTKQDISYFVTAYTKGTVTDYQAAALVMAMYLNGMTKQETTDLSMAMAYSGEVLDLSKLNKIIVDKHSTGGVGDKVSLILLPIVSSLGVPVAKMSGRGLGFTGGTVDKLESIPGYQTEVAIHSFIQNVENIGISMISQTLNLAPADKKLYALRDSISCVESLPLIASSIMSKKIASGAQKIVLDVTCGKGAFMKDLKSARALANEMIEIGKLANRETVCVITNMNEPLGYAVGNLLEVKEVVRFLKGDMPKDLKQVVLELGAHMICLAGLGYNLEENKENILLQIENGSAFAKFKQLVENQGGDSSYLDDISKLKQATYIKPITANKAGYIQEIDAKEIGKLSSRLGAGRTKKEDMIDQAVGIVLKQKIGAQVKEGDILAYLHINQEDKIKDAEESIKQIIKISNTYQEEEKVILDIIQ